MAKSIQSDAVGSFFSLLQPCARFVRLLCRAVLLKLFMRATKPEEPDKYEHIAAILTNVTRLKPGRAMLLEPGRGFIEALVAQLKSANLLRRQGCSAAFRNCCFSAEVIFSHPLLQVINAFPLFLCKWFLHTNVSLKTSLPGEIGLTHTHLAVYA